MTSVISTVTLDNVTKLFGAVRAVSEASLKMTAGEVVAVMGPNGAGKSTLLSLLSLTMRPTRGKVMFNGTPVRMADTELSQRIGLLSHQPLVYPDLTGRENLLLFARLYGLKDSLAAIKEVEKDLDLERFATQRPTRVLSRGQLQRVALARALISKPDFLLLDEPAAGLDSKAVARISTVVKALTERGGVAVMVTHEPEVAAPIATRAVMVKGGRIVSDIAAPDTADQWRKLYVDTVEKGDQ